MYYVWDTHVGTTSTLVSTSTFYVKFPSWVQDIYILVRLLVQQYYYVVSSYFQIIDLNISGLCPTTQSSLDNSLNIPRSHVML